MLNSFKKWVRNDENAQSKQETPVGLQAMPVDLQKKFSKGVQYNLKIVIRGDRNSGKTCLWHRLRGHKFVEEYIPTAEIQATSIQWNYKATDDIVKVDVWDVVDKGKPKQHSNSLKISNSGDDLDDQCMLDASFLDVYKASHAVLLMFDITKKWTYQYVERELPKIPPHLPVLVLMNHRDMGGHRVVDSDEVQALVESIERPPGSAGIFFVESSMKTGFGLKYVHKFFNMPFLLVQRESLMKQLETNHLDVESCLEELHYESISDDHSYERHIQMQEEKQKQSKKPKPEPEPKNVNGTKKDDPVTTPSSPTLNDQSKSRPSSLPVKEMKAKEEKGDGGGLFSPSMMTDAASPTEQVNKEPERKGFMSRFFRGTSAPKPEVRKASEGDSPLATPVSKPVSQGPVDIDKFVPDEDQVDKFLDEIPDSNYSKREMNSDESSSDEDDGNPMVAGFQEDLDSDDQAPSETHKVYSYSDSDDNYITSPTSKPSEMSRSTPKSRISPVPRKEDVKLQHLHIESESSDDDDDQRPYIMPDEDDISDEEPSFQSKPSTSAVKPNSNIDASASSDPDDTPKESEVASDIKHFRPSSASKPIFNQPQDVELSSEEENNTHMVSSVVEDVTDDDRSSPINHEEPAKQKVAFNLQTSDLDFLEQISTTPKKEVLETTAKVEKTGKKKKKRKEKTETENGAKKHKHKKKKSKDKENAEPKTSKKKTKKASDKPSTEDAALEEFLASGEGYESF